MKNWLLIILLASSSGFITACHSGNSTGSGKDTVKNAYGPNVNDTTNASKKNIDTGKVTTTTGDAGNVDDGASGGTKIAKDTAKQKPATKK